MVGVRSGTTLIEFCGFSVRLRRTTRAQLLNLGFCFPDCVRAAQDLEIDREGARLARLEFGNAAEFALDASVVGITGAGLESRHVTFFFGIRVLPESEKRQLLDRVSLRHRLRCVHVL